MANTEFSEFAQELAVTFQGDKSPEKFTQDLFAAIYLPITDENPVEETLPRTYKGYFYGQHNITTLAKKISGSLDPDNFAASITTETNTAIERLCNAFKSTCLGIEPNNYAQKLAERFQAIIEAAAKPKKKKASAKTAEESVVLLEDSDNVKEQYGVFLVAEAGSICANYGCNNSLFVNENGHLDMLYDVAVIDPSVSKNDTNNLIAMCPKCCKKYQLDRTSESISRMQQKKKSLLDAYSDREITSEQGVQEGVRRVLEKIPKMERLQNVDLNYDPVPVRQKIESGNESLYLKAEGHVNVYFSLVHEAFQNLGREGRLRFNPFCLQARMNYLNLKDRGYDQRKIYHALTNWLYEATNEDWDSCEIIISYFIQKCEVFDVISE